MKLRIFYANSDDIHLLAAGFCWALNVLMCKMEEYMLD